MIQFSPRPSQLRQRFAARANRNLQRGLLLKPDLVALLLQELLPAAIPPLVPLVLLVDGVSASHVIVLLRLLLHHDCILHSSRVCILRREFEVPAVRRDMTKDR